MKTKNPSRSSQFIMVLVLSYMIVGLSLTAQAQPVNVWSQVGEDISTVGGFGSGAAISVSQNGVPALAHLSRVRIFNADTNTWSFIDNPITEVGDNQVYQHFNSSASPDNGIYIFFSFFRNNKAYVHRLNLLNNTWTMLGHASVDQTYNMQTATSIVAGTQGRVYLAYRNANLSGHITVRVYNPLTDNWNLLGGATVANGSDQTIALLADGTPILMYRENNQNVIRTYNAGTDSWDLFPEIPLAHLQQPQIAVSPNGTIFALTSATNNPLSIADYMFIVHRWDAENEEWITMNGTQKPAFFGSNHSRAGSVKMVVNEDDIPFVKQVIDGLPPYGYTQVSKWNPNTEAWEFTHPCIDQDNCGINSIHHNGDFKDDITLAPNGEVWVMLMNGPSADPVYQVWKYGPEPEEEIVFDCSALDEPLNTFYPLFTFNFVNEEPINYEVMITDADNNIVIDTDTNTLGTTASHVFITYPVAMAHLGEYEFSVTPIFASGPGVTITCDFSINVPVIYVDTRYPQENVQFGNSWNAPFSHFSQALDFVSRNQAIHVAQGTYVVPGLRDRSFEINNIEEVQILGGFEGGDWVGNPTPGNRDWRNNPTILSGDRLGDDDPNNPFNSDFRDDNTQTIVRVSNVDDTVLMDGFTIYGGNADVPDVADRGAGMFIEDASIQLSNIRFTGNSALIMGGGIYVTGVSNPTLEGIEFISNQGGNYGGGIALDGGTTLINRSFFYDNSADGAIFVSENGNGTIVNTIIHQNQRGIYGSFNEGGSVDVINSTITENSTNGIFANALTVNVFNSIIYGFGMQVDDFVISSGEINLQNSLVMNALPEGVNDLGGNIIGQNPMFEDINMAPSGLALTVFSPAVNAGNNGLLPVAFDVDFSGNNRIFNASVDMGAFELQEDPIGEVLFENFLGVSDDQGGYKELTFGLAELATDGYDPGLDQLAPPMPPLGAFDVRFVSGSPQAGYFKDFRGLENDPIVWTIHFQPDENATEYMLFWSSSSFYMIEGEFILSYGSPAIEVNMRDESMVDFGTEITTATITYSRDTTFERTVSYELGWNLISSPISWEPDPFLIFTSAEPGTLFGFNQAYTDESELYGGRGYWLLLNEDESVTFKGEAFTNASLNLNNGWNMIGSLAEEVVVSEIQDAGSIIVPGSIYKFEASNGYVPASVLESGRGYWIRTSEAGTIGLQTGGSSSSLASTSPQFSHFHQIVVQNNDGAPKEFYLGGTITDDMPPSHAYELPPLPPIGAFDVRFQNHTWLTELRETALLVQSPGENLSLTYLASEDEVGNTMEITLLRSGQEAETITLADGDQVEFSGAGLYRIGVVVNTSTSIEPTMDELPQQLYLAQNYPNPFNPTTNLSFDLPQSAEVSIEVFNIQGQKVATLLRESKPAGRHNITFDASRLASGVYIYRMQVRTGEGNAVTNQVLTRKMTLIK